ncbi:substrate-binding periplasmic protein [Pseudoduganella umbonata]|uniref:ABC-type amino acid transport substrate-binding protein n=1 Tax=Pseudoduganella umbonata TaxID=864828 RepID=A0A4P8HLC8_9BURK|nr:transporter substrate-binding domain-containing protein [Pseudoduganella umbonata]MBB3224911.1 ABC-type amino acid transport substrate-binding protein [Pseudoduganella umbonata]QCP09194.1 transporter substrate-binding domain-containing protein [Pseudoduganella umbonata]
MNRRCFARASALLACAGMATLFAAPARADWQQVYGSGTLKVAVYNEFAPFSDKGAGIDIDLAQALAAKLGVKLSLLPFPADEEVADDLRNMVWKGHYLGYGPADVMMHVPVDSRLMAGNPQVRIFAPYYVETLRLARSARGIPRFDGMQSLDGKRIGVEKVSLSGMLVLGEGEGRLRDEVRIYPGAGEALAALKAGELDAVVAKRSEIESALRGDAAFPLEEVGFQRMPRTGWAVGMAVRNDSEELARRLQAAINDMSANGELEALFARHGVKWGKP